MKLVKILSLPLLASILSVSCKKDERSCPSSKTEFTAGNGKIYIPNIITPNGDGINDRFLIMGDTSIYSYDEIKIKNGKGDVIFEVEDTQIGNVAFLSWNTESYQGRFSYSFEAQSNDGITSKISGHTLSFPGDEKLDCDGCRFGTQHDGHGRFNDGLPTHEQDIDCK